MTSNILAAVQIGFEETLYTIDESAGVVTVSVAVLSGSLSSDVAVAVRLITRDGSARGIDV